MTMRLVLIGNPRSRRTELLKRALARWPHVELVPVPWLDLLADRADLRCIVHAGNVLRIDSPGKDFEIQKALLRVGAKLPQGDAKPGPLGPGPPRP